MNALADGEQIHAGRHELLLESTDHLGMRSVMKSNVMVAHHGHNFDLFWHVKQHVKSPDVVVELCVSHPLSFVEEVAQEDDQLRPEDRHCGLKSAMHLPLPAHLVQPMATVRT